MRNDVRSVLQDLPIGVKGFVVEDGAEDFYTIVLNARYSREANIETYKHELKHIEGGDFRSGESADDVERRAQGIL